MCLHRVEKRNAKGLAKKEKPKKDKTPAAVPWDGGVERRDPVSVGGREARWLLRVTVTGVKALEGPGGGRAGPAGAAHWIQSMSRQRAMNANMSETSSITLAVGFPAPWPALVSTWMSSGLLCFRLRPTTY